MNITEKEQDLLNLLTHANTVMTVKDISNKLFISEPTARRYLSSLSEKGLVVRTHGGAMINYNVSLNKSVPLYLRMTSLSETKELIAQKASELIKDGQFIFLDASSTSFHLLPFLRTFRDITICTNGLKTAITLAEMNINTIALGGEVNLSNLSCNSVETLDMIKNFNADILFFSCDALSSDGILTDNTKESTHLRRQLLKTSAIKVLLMDSSKFNKKCYNNLCSLSDIDYFISDKPLPPELMAMLKKK